MKWMVCLVALWPLSLLAAYGGEVFVVESDAFWEKQQRLTEWKELREVEDHERLSRFIEENRLSLAQLRAKNSDGSNLVSDAESLKIKKKLSIAVRVLPEELEIHTNGSGSAWLDKGVLFFSVRNQLLKLDHRDARIHPVEEGISKTPDCRETLGHALFFLRTALRTQAKVEILLIQPEERTIFVAVGEVGTVTGDEATATVVLKELDREGTSRAVTRHIHSGAWRVGVSPDDYGSLFIHYRAADFDRFEFGLNAQFHQIRLAPFHE